MYINKHKTNWIFATTFSKSIPSLHTFTFIYYSDINLFLQLKKTWQYQFGQMRRDVILSSWLKYSVVLKDLVVVSEHKN